MITRWGGDGVELAHKAHLIADIFKATNTGHQLATTDGGISHTAIVFFNQADAVSFLIFQLHPFKEFTGAALLLTPFDHGQPLAREFDAQMFSRYREKRLKGDFARSNRVKKVAPRTINLELAYFRAVFNELGRLGEWAGENPLKNIRPFRTKESEMAFLTKEQIDLLLIECGRESNSDLVTIVKICLATGARWSEAEDLRRSQINKCKITYTKTKGRKNRTIPISQDIFDCIPQKKGRLFTPCYGAFRSALERTEIELPAGQLTHVLRHTFASHFMMNGGNILVLQRVLGHTDIKMTMRYAHFAPDHLEEAVKLNPLAMSGDKVAMQIV